MIWRLLQCALALGGAPLQLPENPPPWSLEPIVETGEPVLPTGASLQLRLPSLNADVGTSGVIHAPARALCRWQRGMAESFVDTTVLELGAGTGQWWWWGKRNLPSKRCV